MLLWKFVLFEKFISDIICDSNLNWADFEENKNLGQLCNFFSVWSICEYHVKCINVPKHSLLPVMKTPYRFSDK